MSNPQIEAARSMVVQTLESAAQMLTAEEAAKAAAPKEYPNRAGQAFESGVVVGMRTAANRLRQQASRTAQEVVVKNPVRVGRES